MGSHWFRQVYSRKMNAGGETSGNFPNKTLTTKTVSDDTAPVSCGEIEKVLIPSFHSFLSQEEQLAATL